jgi:LAO/AO transport system kinase
MQDWAKRILAGDERALARAATGMENRDPEALALLAELAPHTGHAIIIGVTGAPGAGKSTLVDAMARAFRQEGRSVGILAVDPTSRVSGGAILGDRIRMQSHYGDPGIFIRSMATRGSLGGLARATGDFAILLDAAGKDYVIIETVGVGQDEVEIAGLAQVTVVVLVPGMGDDIQAIKAGIIEIGDLYVINKSDREGADKVERDLRMVLEIGRRKEDGWEPLIIKTEAVTGKGIPDLVQGIYRHKQALEQSQAIKKRLRERAKATFLEILQTEVMSRLIEKIEKEGRMERMIDDLVDRQIDPYSVVEKVMADHLKDH